MGGRANKWHRRTREQLHGAMTNLFGLWGYIGGPCSTGRDTDYTERPPHTHTHLTPQPPTPPQPTCLPPCHTVVTLSDCVGPPISSSPTSDLLTGGAPRRQARRSEPPLLQALLGGHATAACGTRGLPTR